MKYLVKDRLRIDKEYKPGQLVDLGDDAETAETLLAAGVIGKIAPEQEQEPKAEKVTAKAASDAKATAKAGAT